MSVVTFVLNKKDSKKIILDGPALALPFLCAPCWKRTPAGGGSAPGAGRAVEPLVQGRSRTTVVTDWSGPKKGRPSGTPFYAFKRSSSRWYDRSK